MSESFTIETRYVFNGNMDVKVSGSNFEIDIGFLDRKDLYEQGVHLLRVAHEMLDVAAYIPGLAEKIALIIDETDKPSVEITMEDKP